MVVSQLVILLLGLVGLSVLLLPSSTMAPSWVLVVLVDVVAALRMERLFLVLMVALHLIYLGLLLLSTMVQLLVEVEVVEEVEKSSTAVVHTSMMVDLEAVGVMVIPVVLLVPEVDSQAQELMVILDLQQPSRHCWEI